jgi:hypothetical protein
MPIALAAMKSMSAMCREEQAAWTAGDAMRAKVLRLEQHRFLSGHGDAIAGLCSRIRERGERDLYDAAAGIAFEFARTELGDDYATSVLRTVLPDAEG